MNDALNAWRAESKEEDTSSEGTSSGTSDDEEVYVDKNLRF